MTTVLIDDHSPQAKELVAYIRTLPFVTVRKGKSLTAKPKPEPEDEPEFNLYESLNSAFAEVRLMLDGKQRKKSVDEFIEELRREQKNELQH